MGNLKTNNIMDDFNQIKSVVLDDSNKVDDLIRDNLNTDVALISKVSEYICLLYTSPSPRDATLSRMPSSA